MRGQRLHGAFTAQLPPMPPPVAGGAGRCMLHAALRPDRAARYASQAFNTATGSAVRPMAGRFETL